MLRQQANISEINANENIDFEAVDDNQENPILNTEIDRTLTGGDSVHSRDNPISVGRAIEEEGTSGDPPSANRMRKDKGREGSFVSGQSNNGGSAGDEERTGGSAKLKKGKTLKKGKNAQAGTGAPGMGASQVQAMIAKVKMEIEHSLFA